MLRSRQLFNIIRRYTHSHTSQPIKFSKSDYTILESKIDKISSDLVQIRFIVMCNYFIAVIPGIISFFK